jgi:type IX secretion system PorP/SprF family membrane protein
MIPNFTTMKNIKNIGLGALIITGLLLCNQALAQADIHFSQFYETSILRNPALTGVFAEDYKLAALYRNQWSSISNPFQTAMISAEAHVGVHQDAPDYFSFGLLAYYDKAGSIDRKIMCIYPAVNYNKSLEDEHNSFLSAGFTAGIMQYSFDPSLATFNNQYQNNNFNSNNPSGESFVNTKVNMYDLGAGINFNSSFGPANNTTYIIGLSGYHFTQPKNSFYNDPGIVMDMRWNINAALNGNLREDIAYQIHANIALQGAFTEYIAGGLIGYTRSTDGNIPMFAIFGGLLYRLNDAFIPTLKIRYLDYAFGLSYDVNVSDLKAASSMRGGYEISINKTGLFHQIDGPAKKVLCSNFY